MQGVYKMDIPKLERIEVPANRFGCVGGCKGCYFEESNAPSCMLADDCEENGKHYIFKEKEKCNTTH